MKGPSVNQFLILKEILDHQYDKTFTTNDIRENVDVTSQTLSNYLRRLCEKRLIQRIYQGSYEILDVEGLKNEIQVSQNQDRSSRLVQSTVYLAPDMTGNINRNVNILLAMQALHIPAWRDVQERIIENANDTIEEMMQLIKNAKYKKMSHARAKKLMDNPENLRIAIGIVEYIRPFGSEVSIKMLKELSNGE